MTDTEIDAIVTRLVPEFEQTKLESIDAREEFLALTLQACVNREAAAEAQRRWLHLEASCDAILRRIDELAERNVA